MLRCTHHREHGVDLATIEGRFIQDDGTETRNALLYIVATGSGKLVLNLAETTYMDAFGLASLVLVWKAMQHRHGRVVLCAVPRNLEALIEMTRIQSLFEIYTCANTAVAKLAAVPDAVPGLSPPRIAQSDENEPTHAPEQADRRIAPLKISRPRVDQASTDPTTPAVAAA